MSVHRLKPKKMSNNFINLESEKVLLLLSDKNNLILSEGNGDLAEV